MPNLYNFSHMSVEEKRKWETSHSSLIRSGDVTYEQCRLYSCLNIVNNLTQIDVKKGDVIDIPFGTPFHFLGRVDTSKGNNNPDLYYQTYLDRNFVSYSTICNRNISHYKGNIFFIYNLCPEDIVHVFPMDSDTKRDARSEEKLTRLPSLWLTLSELEDFSRELGVYNQITAITKKAGEIIRPYAIATINQTDDYVQKVAEDFGIGTVVLHPDEDAIDYDRDLLYDWFKLKTVSEIMQKRCGFSVESMYYSD